MVTVQLRSRHLRLARRAALSAELGGLSHVRPEAERAEALSEDQLIGQLGTLALHLYWYGHVEYYLHMRSFQRRAPYAGDGGQDLPMGNIDVKTSLMRRSQDVLEYNLLVRPGELYPDWVYVLGLCPSDVLDSKEVHLVGWASSTDFDEPETTGPWAGAYRIPATKLKTLPPVRWLLEI